MRTHVEALAIGTDDQRIAATLLSPAARIPGVLFVHGWGGSQAEDLVRDFERQSRTRRRT